MALSRIYTNKNQHPLCRATLQPAQPHGWAAGWAAAHDRRWEYACRHGELMHCLTLGPSHSTIVT
jgi:hypothetical protein